MQAAIPKKLASIFGENDVDVFALMKQTKMEAIASGKKEIQECDDYLEIMNEALQKQKDETVKCTTTHTEDIEDAESSSQSDADALHSRAEDVGEKLKACKEEEELLKGLECLSKTSESQQRELSKIQSDSAKLQNKHKKKIATADNNLEFCKTEVTYFYGDVVDDIMGLYRVCVFYGDIEDYEIPEFVKS